MLHPTSTIAGKPSTAFQRRRISSFQNGVRAIPRRNAAVLTPQNPIMTPDGGATLQSPSTGVRTIDLPAGAFDGYASSVLDGFPKQGVPLDWQTDDLPAVHKVITASYQLLVSRLPLEVLEQLLALAHDPSAPSALLIRGLPLDTDIPATPASRKGIGREKNVDKRLPVGESIILGAAKVLGGPMMAASIAKGNRGGLVSDLVGVDMVTYTHKVPMKPHVEFGAMGSARPDFVLFLGVRQDHADTCRTLITDNRALLAALDPADVSLLRQHPVTLMMPNGAPGPSWTVVDGPDSDPRVTLFDPVILPKITIVGPTDEVTAAYSKALNKANEIAEQVAVRPGELLIVNQARANKGRSAYQLAEDGKDWWLLKTYAKQHMWGRMGEAAPSALRWPQLVVPGF